MFNRRVQIPFLRGNTMGFVILRVITVFSLLFSWMLIETTQSFKDLPRAQAATRSVTTEAELVQTINDANTAPGPDTIQLTADINLATTTPFAVSGNNGLPSITSQIIIQGNGHTIRRTSATQFRLFHVGTNGALWLDHITLENGDAGTDNGGAIYAQGDALIITNSTIGGSTGGNKATQGGGIYCNTPKLVTVNVIISENIALDEGGGIVTGYSCQSILLVRSQVSNNHVTGTGNAVINKGGAISIYSTSYSSVFTAIDTQFNNNEVLGTTDWTYGGGLYIRYGTITLLNSSVNNNRAVNGGDRAEGGGLYTYMPAQVSLIASEFNGNHIETQDMIRGGALYITNTSLLMEDVEVIGNTCLSTRASSYSGVLGGGLYTNSRL